MQRSRYWCYTVNNPDNQLCFSDAVLFSIWQLEHGENKTPHYQGVLVLQTAQRLSYVKKIIPTAHWEMMISTLDDCVKYCTKLEGRLDGPFTHGEMPAKAQGKRNDLVQFKDQIKTGITRKELLDEHPAIFARYPHFYDTVRNSFTKDRNFKTEVIWIHGPPGTGKSRYCQDNYPGAYWKPSGPWWDRYDYQDVVILDDHFTGGVIDISFYLNLLDRYALEVPVKGSTRVFCSKTIVITSNHKPEDLIRFPTTEIMNAFLRRIDKYIDFTPPHADL